jgi:hypothetical protein
VADDETLRCKPPSSSWNLIKSGDIAIFQLETLKLLLIISGICFIFLVIIYAQKSIAYPLNKSKWSIFLTCLTWGIPKSP